LFEVYVLFIASGCVMW